MKSKNIFFISIACTLVLIVSSCDNSSKNSEQKKVQAQNQLLVEIENMLIKLNQEFKNYEATQPHQGYCVTIPNDITQAHLHPHGGLRTSQQLSGIPLNQEEYEKKCPFCLSGHKNLQQPIVQNFYDGTCAITSLSNQILIIPQQHYAHLFAAPLTIQIALIKNALSLRESHKNMIKKPIEFHCGSAAGQTVFHIHCRTGIYTK